jgi:hypothetical protein
MTRKHFEAIAALLNNANLAVVDENGNPQAADIVVADLCNATADYFASENPRFDRAKFLTACGL